MKTLPNMKENIIEVTTELIEQNGGETKNITTRMIAEKAGIGLGLVNYHFKSKENLITICVQRIIEKVVAGFHMEKEYTTDKERLTAWATYVFDFLFEHPAISRISILGDLENYSLGCNSLSTQRGFMLALTKDLEEKDKPLFSFVLTSAMQVAFLSGTTAKDLLGYDFTQQADRAAYIKTLVNLLFEGMRKEHSL